MRNALLGVLIAFFFFGTKSFAAAPSDVDRLNIYVAAGTAWAFPGSIRIGTRTVEGGLIAPGVVGVIYNLWDDSVSVSLGTGAAALGNNIGYGLMTALGYQWNLFWIFKLRGEVFAFGSHNGWVLGGAQVGLNLTF